MFNSFVRAVSGLNPFGKAAETTNDIVVPVGGIDEATLNNEGEPQQAPPERERRQVREMRPDKRDLEAGEIYYEAVKKWDIEVWDLGMLMWELGVRCQTGIHSQCRDNFERGKSRDGGIMNLLR